MRSDDEGCLQRSNGRDDGECRGCGECCSRFLPLSRFDVRRLRDYVKRNDIEPRPDSLGELDLMCPLLSDAHECMAYDARPEICRAYRCDLHARGELRPPSFFAHAEIMDMRLVLAE